MALQIRALLPLLLLAAAVRACGDDHAHDHGLRKRAYPQVPLTAPTSPLQWGDINISALLSQYHSLYVPFSPPNSLDVSIYQYFRELPSPVYAIYARLQSTQPTRMAGCWVTRSHRSLSRTTGEFSSPLCPKPPSFSLLRGSLYLNFPFHHPILALPACNSPPASSQSPFICDEPKY